MAQTFQFRYHFPNKETTIQIRHIYYRSLSYIFSSYNFIFTFIYIFIRWWQIQFYGQFCGETRLCNEPGFQCVSLLFLGKRKWKTSTYINERNEREYCLVQLTTTINFIHALTHTFSKSVSTYRELLFTVFVHVYVRTPCREGLSPFAWGTLPRHSG